MTKASRSEPYLDNGNNSGHHPNEARRPGNRDLNGRPGPAYWTEDACPNDAQLIAAHSHYWPSREPSYGSPYLFDDGDECGCRGAEAEPRAFVTWVSARRSSPSDAMVKGYSGAEH